MKKINRIIAFVLLQIFLISCSAAGTQRVSAPDEFAIRDSLSPALNLNSSYLVNVFHYWAYLKNVNDENIQFELTRGLLDKTGKQAAVDNSITKEKGDPSRVYNLKAALEEHKTSILILVEKGMLFEASAKFRMMKGRGVDLDEEQVELLRALKKTGDFVFQAREYKEALRYYQEIIDIAPHETDIYFYIGAAMYMRGNMDIAQVNFEKAVKKQPQMPMFVLVTLMFEAKKLGERILELTDKNNLQVKKTPGSLFDTLKKYDKLIGHVEYIFKNRAEEIETFVLNDVNGMIIDSIFADFIGYLNSFERSLQDREILEMNDILKTPELFWWLEKLTKGKVVPLIRPVRSGEFLKLEKDFLKIATILSFSDKKMLEFAGQAI
ncbi:MAG: hypothetical protein V1739_08930 [Candidatus Omnitrophota bacterium]